MRIGVLGTGVVGRTIGSKLVQLGHEVTMGSRSADNESATAWASEAGENAAHGTFEDAAVAGALVSTARRAARRWMPWPRPARTT